MLRMQALVLRAAPDKIVDAVSAAEGLSPRGAPAGSASVALSSPSGRSPPFFARFSSRDLELSQCGSPWRPGPDENSAIRIFTPTRRTEP